MLSGEEETTKMILTMSKKTTKMILTMSKKTIFKYHKSSLHDYGGAKTPINFIFKFYFIFIKILNYHKKT
jgi:hypothetical protein